MIDEILAKLEKENKEIKKDIEEMKNIFIENDKTKIDKSISEILL